MSTIGLNQPLYLSPFGHREAFEKPEVTRR